MSGTHKAERQHEVGTFKAFTRLPGEALEPTVASPCARAGVVLGAGEGPTPRAHWHGARVRLEAAAEGPQRRHPARERQKREEWGRALVSQQNSSAQSGKQAAPPRHCPGSWLEFSLPRNRTELDTAANCRACVPIQKGTNQKDVPVMEGWAWCQLSAYQACKHCTTLDHI
ncbi:hypothetical protein NDU88_006663 [Pleurodeles waltl]|uniref:Uncharacterized protein n=1 Tax=Pleurodeles waltl TaxID=8319 RepID=A0AAV7MGK2_PLEWA|nr:hypothetical protein NDU88_006663 [Pleurodeles waltl]